MRYTKYQIDIKPIERGARPNKGYERSDCAACDLQIRKIGVRNSTMEMLESIARNSFIFDTTKKHRLILYYKKE